MRRKNYGKGKVVESDSFALFSDEPFVSVVAGSDDNGIGQEKEDKEIQAEERSGAQAADEEPEHAEHPCEKAHHTPKRGFRAIKNVEGDSRAKDSPVRERRHGDEEAVEGNREIGKPEEGSDRSTRGKVKGTRRAKQKVQEGEGGAGSGKDDRKDREVDVEYDKYPISEFEPSSKVITKKITGKPRETEDKFTVEIVIDGLRYKVSRNSVRDGNYIQGLDSMFIVSKLITKK